MYKKTSLGSPKATSTPNAPTIKGRKSYKDYRVENNDSLLSPINHKDDHDDESNSDDNGTSDDGDNYSSMSDGNDHVSIKRKGDLFLPFILTLSFVALLIAMVYGFMDSGVENDIKVKKIFEPELRLKEIAKEFPDQSDEFWLNIKVALADIYQLNKPRSIIFLHDSEKSHKTNLLMPRIASVVKCIISLCEDPNSKEIILTADKLNSKRYVEDYGRIIDECKNSLEQNGVMIVYDLDKVSPKSAQAFHSLCDEYNPAVRRALFLFTVEIPHGESVENGGELKFLENLLKQRWGDDLKEEVFYPLLTRISDVALRVV